MEEVEIAIKEMKNGKATGLNGIPIELVKYLDEGNKKILSLCNKIYNEGPKNYWRFCYYQYRRKVMRRNVRSSGPGAYLQGRQRTGLDTPRSQKKLQKSKQRTQTRN